MAGGLPMEASLSTGHLFMFLVVQFPHGSHSGARKCTWTLTFKKIIMEPFTLGIMVQVVFLEHRWEGTIRSMHRWTWVSMKLYCRVVHFGCSPKGWTTDAWRFITCSSGCSPLPDFTSRPLPWHPGRMHRSVIDPRVSSIGSCYGGKVVTVESVA